MRRRDYIFFAILLGVIFLAGLVLQNKAEGLAFQLHAQIMPNGNDPENPDIALMKLNEPLKPGGKIVISTPFNLKIPASFSRLGHVDQSYQITQWFPKKKQ